jgi:hypothetical protein
MPRDANDILRECGPEVLRAKIDNAFTRRTTKANGAARPASPGYISLGEIELQPEARYLIKGLLPDRGLACIYGPPGGGKTFVALDLALNIAAGLKFCGRRVRQAGVIYFAAESGGGFLNRVAVAREQLGVPHETPFIVSMVPPDLGGSPGDTQKLLEEIFRQSSRFNFQPGVIVLDTLARVIPCLDENSAKDMGIFVRNAETIARAIGGLVIGIHHSGKANERTQRGSSALHGATECEWCVTAGAAGNVVEVVRQKDGDSGLAWTFKIVRHPIGTDSDGDEVSVGKLEWTSLPEQKKCSARCQKKEPRGQTAELLKGLKTAIIDQGKRLPSGKDYPANTRGVSRQAFAPYAKNLGFMDGKTAEVQAATLRRLIRTAAGNGFVGQWGEWLWLP